MLSEQMDSYRMIYHAFFWDKYLFFFETIETSIYHAIERGAALDTDEPMGHVID